MATSHGNNGSGCSRKRARNPHTDVELIDLEDMELEQNQQGLFPSDGEPCLPTWAKKRTDFWVKDATEFLCLEPNTVGAGESPVDAHMQADEFHMNIPLHRMLLYYSDFREKCVICYHKSRALQDAEMEQWMLSDDDSHVAVEHVWPLGHGFFAVKFGSKSAAAKVLSNGEMPFNEGHVQVVPYIPCFFPSADAKQTWPVWVSFPHLPLFLRPFLQEIASSLGKVLHVSQPSCVISPALPRVCILWDARKKAPRNVEVSFDHMGAMKLPVEFDTIGVPAGASHEHEKGEERGGIIEPLPLLLPAPASNDKEPLLPSRTGIPSCASAPSHLGKGPEPAIAQYPKEIKGPIITSPVSTLLGKGISGCPIANPIQVTQSLSIASCLMADEHGGAKCAFGREARTTYDNALYQHKKSKPSGKELAVVAPHHHAMKEVSSNSQVKHTTDSKKHASKNLYSVAGSKENIGGSRKDPKFDKENIVTRKDFKDEEKSVNKRDHKSVSGHTDKNGTAFQSPEALTSPKPYYLSPLPYGTPFTS